MSQMVQDEHRWLERLVGEWAYETEASMSPGAPPEKFTGVERVRSIGGLWVVLEGMGDKPGGDIDTMMTLGYDASKQRYVGGFVGSMMTHLWVYEGTLDAAGNELTLDTEGPGFADDQKTAKYKDTVRFDGRDRRVLTSRYLGDDGEWHEVMTMHYRRKA